MVDADVPGARTEHGPRLLYCGELTPGTTSEMRVRALREIGFDVTCIPLWPTAPSRAKRLLMALSFKLRYPIDFVRANAAMVELAASHDIVWIDKGITVRRETLRRIRGRNPAARIVGYSPDNMTERPFNSAYFLSALPEYDAFITTKSFGVGELAALGARRVIFSQNAFDPAVHRPPARDAQASRLPMLDVGFVGTFEEDRAQAILEACRAGITIHVFGNGWSALRRPLPPTLRLHPSVQGADYASTVGRFRIALCFLRRLSRDLQTTRSVEIPACGSFMLAERTEEHRALFAEGVEAEYFSGTREMIEKITRYLVDAGARERIAQAGLAKTRTGRHSYAWRLHEALRAAGVSPPHEPAAVEAVCIIPTPAASRC